jgi:glycosyltransferase involved in cell wall biosynthesis
MNILLDAIPLDSLGTGISRYLRNLYSSLEKFSGVTVYYYNGKRCTKKMPGGANAESWIKKTNFAWKLPDYMVFAYRTATWLGFEYRVRRLLANGGFHVYHETAFTPSAIKNVPQVFTLHDLSLMKYRAMHPRERVWFSDLFFDRRIHRATHIITVSNFVRSEICNEFPIDPDRVTTIWEAPDPSFFPRKREKIDEVIKRLKLPRDYLLFVGTLEPRKNLSLLIKALARGKDDIPIVLVGWKGWGDNQWWQVAKEAGITKRIFTTGFVDEESLSCLYSGALALVFPSHYEGFGLPLLEAMACGCPVVSSNAASLPEVAGDAAVFIDPNDDEDLADAMNKVVFDSEVRDKLKLKGLERAKEFSWERAAEKTLAVFGKVAGFKNDCC